MTYSSRPPRRANQSAQHEHAQTSEPVECLFFRYRDYTAQSGNRFLRLDYKIASGDWLNMYL